MCKAVELYAEKRAREAVELYAEKKAKEAVEKEKEQSILVARIAADQRAADNALKMLASGKLSLEEISKYTGLSISVVEELANQKRA